MSNNECPICYDNENEIEQNIKLECGHKFHDKCILEWCKNSLSCPMCRCNITDERCVEIRRNNEEPMQIQDIRFYVIGDVQHSFYSAEIFRSLTSGDTVRRRSLRETH